VKQESVAWVCMRNERMHGRRRLETSRISTRGSLHGECRPECIRKESGASRQAMHGDA
jgi:hypothetical protein